MNEWLAAAPTAEVTQGMTGCMVSLNDLCDRPPVPMADGEQRDIGGHVMQWFDTPHLPHGWEAGVLYDTTTKTLFCGDLFTQLGAYEPTSDAELVSPAAAAEDMFHSMSLAPDSGERIRRLAELDVTTLALMHGPAFTGDCRAALLGLADDVDKRISAATPT
jgi:flavorubredoxin